MQQKPRLYYAYDPMCSWCYGFEATRSQLFGALEGKVEIVRLVGGLAPDSSEPMPQEMRSFLQQTWHKIADRIPGVEFNHAFWSECEPRRSTYPACRAVLSARLMDVDYEQKMNAAIQRAYYQQARNPSDDSTLIELASEIGLDAKRFTNILQDPATHQLLLDEIARGRALGLDSFPSLSLEVSATSRWPIALDYNNAATMQELIESMLTD